MIRIAVALALLLAAAPPARAEACKGFKSAHCRCQLRYPDDTPPSTAPGAWLRPTGYAGKELMTYTVPGKCFNQQQDAIEFRLNKGCWLACRNGYGVDGATPDPELKHAIGSAGIKLHSQGFCGGWINAPSYFAAGTNKFRPNTNVGIGIGVGPVVVKDGKTVCK